MQFDFRSGSWRMIDPPFKMAALPRAIQFICQNWRYFDVRT